MKSTTKCSDASSEITQDFLRSVIGIQQQQNEKLFEAQHNRDQQLQQLIGHHKQLAISMSLPNVQVPIPLVVTQ